MSIRLNAFGLSFIIFLLLVTSRVQNSNLRARENDASNMQLSTWRRLWKLKTEKGEGVFGIVFLNDVFEFTL